MPDIKVGDEVRVFDVNGSRMGQPQGGWHGSVVKVGRKLVDIKYGGRIQKFRIDDRRSNDSYGHQSFKTPAEVTEDERREHAVEALNAQHIQVTPQCRLTVDQLEALADVVRKFR